jgi:hypothetical protein
MLDRERKVQVWEAGKNVRARRTGKGNMLPWRKKSDNTSKRINYNYNMRGTSTNIVVASVYERLNYNLEGQVKVTPQTSP